MLSFSYHFANVQDSFSSSSSYQQALKCLVLVIVLVQLIVNILEYSKVMSYILQYNLNTSGILTCIQTYPITHSYLSLIKSQASACRIFCICKVILYN